MEVPESAAPAATGGEAALGGVDFEAILDGANPEQVLAQGQQESTPAEPTPTPEGQEQPQEAKPEEAVEPKTEEETPEQTAKEEFSEPLPGKLGALLKAVEKTSPDLARQIRSDHEALNGPEGYRAVFPKLEEAVAYRQVAPTLDDLKALDEFSTRYENLDRLYREDQPGLLRMVMSDPEFAPRLAASWEPTLRAMSPQLYAEGAKPFNQNFLNNLIALEGQAGEEAGVEYLRQLAQKYLGGLNGGQRGAVPQGQDPRDQEIQRLRAELDGRSVESRQGFFNDINREAVPSLKGEVVKYLTEKIGARIPEGAREDLLDEMASNVADQIFSEMNGNRMVAGHLKSVIESGDLSPAHRQAALSAVMERAKAYIAQKSAEPIRKWNNRLSKMQSGTVNSPTRETTATKNVGQGATPASAVKTGPAPEGAPQGWNLMKPDERAKYVDWTRTSDEDFMALNAGFGDPKTVVLKKRA